MAKTKKFVKLKLPAPPKPTPKPRRILKKETPEHTPEPTSQAIPKPGDKENELAQELFDATNLFQNWAVDNGDFNPPKGSAAVLREARVALRHKQRERSLAQKGAIVKKRSASEKRMTTEGTDKMEASDVFDENRDIDMMDGEGFYDKNGEIVKEKRDELKAQSAITMASMIRMPSEYEPISSEAPAGMARVPGEGRQQREQRLRNTCVPRKKGAGNGVCKPHQKKSDARKKAKLAAKCADKGLEDINILFNIASLYDAPKPKPKAPISPFADVPQPKPGPLTGFAATLATAVGSAKSGFTGASTVLPHGSHIHAAMSPGAIARAKNAEGIDQAGTRYGPYDSPNPFDVTAVIGLPGQVVQCCRNPPGVVSRKVITLQDIPDDQLSSDELVLKRKYRKPIDIPDEECTPNQLAAKKQMIGDKKRAVRYEQERKLRKIRRETGQSTQRDMFQDMIYYSFWEKKPAGMDKERLEAYKRRYFDHCEKLANEQAKKIGYPIKFPEVEDKPSKRGARKPCQQISVVEGEEVGYAEAADGEVAENGVDGDAPEEADPDAMEE